MRIKRLLHQSGLALAIACLSSGSAMAQQGPKWLGDAVFYQIYPSSYMDTDGNGIGDLPGITQKLDYIKSIGVNALWLNPIFESGWFDGGYDVIDYYKVDPRFGTNSDLVTLVNEAHKRGIKVCLDLVAGHTSSECAWFKASAEKDPNGRYSDYFIWLDDISDAEKQEIVARRQEPDPAASTRGRYVEANAPRAKYYEKNFFECQPALNYGFANPDPSHPWEQSVDAPGPQAVRREMRNIMSFWFDKGIDGFRVDMAPSLVKNDPDKKAVSLLWNEMREWKDKNYPECVLISEWSDPAVAIPAGFNIDFMIHFGIKGYPSLFFAKNTPWGRWEKYDYCYFDRSGKGSISEFIDNYTKAYTATKDKGYIAIPSSNHDYQRPNVADRNTLDQLKVTMTFFLTMPGVPFIYYGDEIAMKYQMDLPSKEGSNDRAGTRTPMQWKNNQTAGFSSCTPDQLYFPVDTENGILTVEAQENDPNSMLNFVRQLTALRHGSKALGNDGDWQLLSDVSRPYPMIYQRSFGSETYIIALNPSGQKVSATLSIGPAQPVMLSGKASLNKDKISLHAFTAAIYKTK